MGIDERTVYHKTKILESARKFFKDHTALCAMISSPKLPTMSKISIVPVPKCFVHEKADERDKARIRDHVCKGLPADHEFSHRNWCVLHLPHGGKVNSTDFHEKVNAKVQKRSNDFSYIYVPDSATFISKTLSGPACFDYVTFASNAEFGNRNFTDEVSFQNAVFLQDANFYSARFNGESNFSKAKFLKNANFNDARFAGIAKFQKTGFESNAFFRSTEFEAHITFEHFTFKESPDFFDVRFRDLCEFTYVNFPEGVNFSGASFSGHTKFWFSSFANLNNFSSTRFDKSLHFNFSKFKTDSIVRFDQALFFDVVSLQQTDIQGFFYFEGGERKICPNGVEKSEGLTDCFRGNDVHLVLDNARIEKSDKIFFHTVRLRPNWFINIDCRKFVFTAVEWRMNNNKRLIPKAEIKALESRNIGNPHKLLTKTCWQLADNYEEARSFGFASVFRQIANESKRLEGYRGLKIWSLHWWYWISSFYGESTIKAAGVLALIILGFAIIYMHTEFQVCPAIKSTSETVCELRNLSFWEATLQSFATATFQTLEFRRVATDWGVAFTIAEKILAPLQAALLALAIRRKFMR